MKYFAAALFLLLFSTVSADAIPAFAKKYEAPCGLCHSIWPKLTNVGVKFKMNGYQMPDSEDGGTTAKISPEKNLFLDIGEANPPLSLVLNGGITLMQPQQGAENQQQDKFYCCVQGNAVTAVAGGTLGPNIAYYLSLPWGKENASEAYIRFVNAFSPGLLNLDIGAMKVIDYDVTSPGREWFGTPAMAYHGHPYNETAHERGMTAAHNDTGIRVYGRPGFEKFSYELGLYSGNQLTGAAEDDSSLAYTAMGRMDFDHAAISIRYWGNKTGVSDQMGVTSGGESLVFAADPFNADEGLTELTLAGRFHTPDFEFDLIVDATTYSIGTREATGSDGTVHAFSQGDASRLAISAEVIWLINSWLQTGVAYGYSSTTEYDQTMDGTTTTIEGEQSSMLALRMEIRPVVNVRLGLEVQIDTTAADYRHRSNGEEFDGQHKVLLQWNMAL